MGLDKTIRENKQVKKIEKKLSGWPRTVGAVPNHGRSGGDHHVEGVNRVVDQDPLLLFVFFGRKNQNIYVIEYTLVHTSTSITFKIIFPNS